MRRSHQNFGTNGYKELKQYANNIINDYKSGKSTVEIAEKYFSNKGIIRYLLKKNGVVLRNDRNSYINYFYDSTFFDNIDTPEKANVLGMWCADGTNEPNYNKIKLTLQDLDREILEDIRSLLKVEKPLTLYKRHEKDPNWHDAYELIIYDKHMCESLSDKGCVPNKSLILEWNDNLREDLYPHFIRGYFDGDGGIGKEKYGVAVNFTSSRKFCEGLSKFLLNLGIYNRIDNVKTNKDTAKVVITRKAEAEKLFLYMYKNATIFMRRKYLRFIYKFPQYENYCYLKKEPDFEEIDKKDKELVERKKKEHENKSAFKNKTI